MKVVYLISSLNDGRDDFWLRVAHVKYLELGKLPLSRLTVRHFGRRATEAERFKLIEVADYCLVLQRGGVIAEADIEHAQSLGKPLKEGKGELADDMQKAIGDGLTLREIEDTLGSGPPIDDRVGELRKATSALFDAESEIASMRHGGREAARARVFELLAEALTSLLTFTISIGGSLTELTRAMFNGFYAVDPGPQTQNTDDLPIIDGKVSVRHPDGSELWRQTPEHPSVQMALRNPLYVVIDPAVIVTDPSGRARRVKASSAEAKAAIDQGWRVTRAP